MASRVIHRGAICWFLCPACLIKHNVYIKKLANKDNPVWNWNWCKRYPVFTGKTGTSSIGTCHNNQGGFGCHSFVGTQGAKPGFIKFCPDCDHHLAGKTVELPPVTPGLAKKFVARERAKGIKDIWEMQIEKGIHYQDENSK